MNNKEVKWEIKEIAPGMIEIKANPLGKIPTIDDFKQKAKELLTNRKQKNLDNLIDGTFNSDIAEGLLLKEEFLKLDIGNKSEGKIHQIRINYNGTIINVNSKNIDSVFSKKVKSKLPANNLEDNPNLGEEILDNLEER